jgi:RimJ/RimL family protein N-acetyltransferase
MNIQFQKLNVNDDEQLNALVKWDNDIDLYHLITPVRDKDKVLEFPTYEVLKNNFDKNPSFAAGIYIIYDGIKPIGSFSLQIDPGHLFKKITGTSWLGLTIGEKEYWGSGAAAETMLFFEQKSISLGLKRVELGTFEFNTRAQKFYKKLGYVEIGRLKDFTYWNGKYWDDIRMEKILL